MDLKSNLPWDIICYEILARASMETIGRFRAVSKDSNHITYTPPFIQSFHQRTKRVSGYFISKLWSTPFLCIDQPNTDCEISLKFMPGPVKILASSNVFGLLLCCDHPCIYRSWRDPPPSPRYYVCKPSTRQWQVLPDPTTGNFIASTAMIVLRADPLYYKIVRLSESKKRSNDYDYRFKRLRIEVFDSKSWVWRQLDDVTLPCGSVPDNAQAIAASGALHWQTSDGRILAFDAKKETCDTFMLPEPFHSNRSNYCFVEVIKYKGGLAAMGLIRKLSSDGSLEMWVMEDYSHKTWMKVGNFNPPEPCARPIGFYNDETAVLTGFWGLCLYKFKNKVNNVSKLNINYGTHRRAFFYYESDFQPCDMMTKN